MNAIIIGMICPCSAEHDWTANTLLLTHRKARALFIHSHVFYTQLWLFPYCSQKLWLLILKYSTEAYCLNLWLSGIQMFQTPRKLFLSLAASTSASMWMRLMSMRKIRLSPPALSCAKHRYMKYSMELERWYRRCWNLPEFQLNYWIGPVFLMFLYNISSVWINK